MKNLHRFGLIGADDLTSRILDLTAEEYASELDMTFGEPDVVR
jgi:hypothetical protein